MDQLVLRDARMLVSSFVKIQPGEKVAVFTEPARRHEGEAFALAAEEAGADVIVVDIGRQVADLLGGEEFFIPPAPHVLGIMEGCNVGVFVVDETYAFRLDHKLAGVISTSEDRSFFSIDPGMGTWRFTAADVAEVDERCERLLKAMEGGDRIHLTTRKGTDLHLSIKGRECLYVSAVPWRGLHSVYPIPLWGELNWAPIEDFTYGTVIVDGLSEATEKLKDVAGPVIFTIADGRINDVSGETIDAEEFRAVTKYDENANVIGEFGIGANHKALDATQSAKAKLGTIHLGLGENGFYPGGQNRSLAHIDAGVRDVTVSIDGRVVIQDGVIVA
jgi:leucyl aminopeptidase (aminopeptidase T)